MKITLEMLQQKKARKLPIAMLTAYDYPTALFEEQAGIDSILVGDSVGTNVLGYVSEQEVTLADMIHHVRAVKRAVTKAFLIADLPYRSADTADQAFENASQLVSSGADCVKLEGWSEKSEIIRYLVARKIVVCAHIGYNPQIHGAKPRTFGKEAQQAYELLESALKLESAGASLLVIEKVPEEVAEIITAKLKIPTIGIGCGRRCDGQVLVINDILGLSSRAFRHARQYLDLNTLVPRAINAYCTEVRESQFPAESHSLHMDPEELRLLQNRLGT